MKQVFKILLSIVIAVGCAKKKSDPDEESSVAPAPTATPTPSPYPEISSFTAVEGSGINHDAAKSVSTLSQQMIVYDSHLYMVFLELDGSNLLRVRLSVYNGDDNAPAFTEVSGSAGLNKSATTNAGGPQLAVHSGKLYVSWSEGVPAQVRVISYDGSSFSFVDGGGANGINHDSTVSVGPANIVSFDGALWAMWVEGTPLQLRVASYDGSSWTFRDGNGTTGVQKDTSQVASVGKLIVMNGSLYATWRETYNAKSQMRAAKLVSNTFTLIDGNAVSGLNRDITQGIINYPSVVSNTAGTSLYLGWTEGVSGGTKQIRVMRYATESSDYNGSTLNTWSYLDPSASVGLNYDTAQQGQNPSVLFAHDRVYTSWDEGLTGGAKVIRVASYSGAATNTFTFVSPTAGLARDVTKVSTAPQMILFNDKVYLSWTETTAGGVNSLRVSVAQ